MASAEKAREFLKASDAHKHYTEILELALAYFITKAEQEGNSRFVEDLQKARREYHKEFEEAIECTEAVYQEIFTDEELDNLIILHSNPALKKARDLTGQIVEQVLEKYSKGPG